MGGADIIPGVSGGTVALITGIYERLIDAIKSINLLFAIYFFRGFLDKKYFLKSKQIFRNIDFKFILPLLFGIATAFLLIANIIGPVFDSYPTYAYSFFFGLILASSFLVYFNIKKLNVWVPIFIFLGILVGYMIVGLEAIQTTHNFFIIFLSGVITICAMILPGISGAFILLLLGQYNFMLNVLRGFTSLDFSGLPYAISYIFGGAVGIITLSRVLSYFIKNHRLATLSFLLGLMLGALRKPGEFIINQPENIMITIFSSIFGIIIVVTFSYYKIYSEKKTASL